MRILFWGTPEFAVPPLRALLGEGHDIVGVVTQPDRPHGRGRRPKASEVKTLTLSEGLRVLTPELPRGESFLDEIRAIAPEVSVVAAYGHILVPEVLDVPEHGSLNVHASLLPELRGAAPINWAIVRGHDRTGITIMRMTEGMDEGPILLQREIPIAEDDTASGLYLRLAELGAEAVVEALALLEAGSLEPVEQDHSRATYAPKVDREAARIDWSLGANEISCHVRGMDAVPGAWTTLASEPVKLFSPAVVRGEPRGLGGVGRAAPNPGVVIEAAPEVGLTVAAGDGRAVRFGEVQSAGKRRMAAGEWLLGRSGLVGKPFE